MLDRAPALIVKGAFARALTAAAVPIVDALVSRTPVLTGDLALHVVTDIAVDEQGRGGVAQVGFGKKGYIARFVEYGHREIGRKSHKELGAVQPHPFMRPAAAESGDASVAAFAASMQESFAQGIPGVKTK